MLKTAARLKESGVQLIALLALSDEGKPWYDANNAARFASNAAVFASNAAPAVAFASNAAGLLSVSLRTSNIAASNVSIRDIVAAAKVAAGGGLWSVPALQARGAQAG